MQMPAEMKARSKKVCFKCGTEKPIAEFYPHKQMGDKHLNKCKDCARNDTEERRMRLSASNPAWVEAEKERQRQKAVQYGMRFPEKTKAHKAMRTPKSHDIARHHWSYRAEHRTNVIELQRHDHLTVHRYMVYDQERMMYRKLSGELIDSRESALAYYAEILSART